MFCEVDDAIRRGGYQSGHNLEQAFSDVHDSGVYREEVSALIRKRLLAVIPLSEPPGPRDYCTSLMGYHWTVDLTDRAMRIFWPALYAKRERRAPSPQSRGGQARAAKLSPERRREIARAAALSRWAKL